MHRVCERRVQRAIDRHTGDRRARRRSGRARRRRRSSPAGRFRGRAARSGTVRSERRASAAISNGSWMASLVARTSVALRAPPPPPRHDGRRDAERAEPLGVVAHAEGDAVDDGAVEVLGPRVDAQPERRRRAHRDRGRGCARRSGTGGTEARRRRQGALLRRVSSVSANSAGAPRSRRAQPSAEPPVAVQPPTITPSPRCGAATIPSMSAGARSRIAPMISVEPKITQPSPRLRRTDRGGVGVRVVGSDHHRHACRQADPRCPGGRQPTGHRVGVARRRHGTGQGTPGSA